MPFIFILIFRLKNFFHSYFPIKLQIIFLFITGQLLYFNCSGIREDKLFKLRDFSYTGLNFNNKITISDSLNAVKFEYIYNGGGAAVGDVNHDGIKDLFFSGNMVSSRLYLGKGNLKYEDISGQSGVTTDSWCTGASFVDINSDGLLDLYICVAGLAAPDNRRNIFFINQGIDENGIPHFLNKAQAMGLDDDGYSTMAAFFDYDKDNDLDMYLLTNSMEGNQRNMLKSVSKDGSEESTDRFYRNNGDGTFTNWSKEAGILVEGYGLGISLCDINQDNWIDVYCSNDFISNDLLWINNQDGTFTEMAGQYFKHFTNNGMGMDIADYNNDGLPDVFVLDMMPITNLRQKLMFAFRSMDRMHEAVEMGYLTQYLRNTLQLNLGKFADGKYRFSEIGMLAGIYQTDWSWAPLLVDFDNDGWKDLLITNGYRKDVTNLDYITEIIRETSFRPDNEKESFLLNAIYNLEDVKLPNHIYKNNKDLTFEDKSKDWGLDIPTFSNGTIIADLDDDGDVDIVVNNIDEEVYLFENLTNRRNDKNQSHHLTLRFDRKIPDNAKIGAKIWIFQKNNNQFFEYSPYRGYKSTVDPDIHIGLGENLLIDSLIVQWPAGGGQRMLNITGNSIYIITRSDSLFSSHPIYLSEFNSGQVNELVMEDITDSLNLLIKHNESYTNDFRYTPTLIRSMSKNGPSLAVGDVDNDGLDDIVMGGDRDKKTVLLKQESNNTFSEKFILKDSLYEDVGTLLFDADGDNDLDLYIVSGGSLWRNEGPNYQDRLYTNDGSGKFNHAVDALPEISTSGSCVVAGDYDQDGDLDLFIGGRLVPRMYPTTPKSYLLENQNGKFHNRSSLLDTCNGKLGMITSALWSDVNNDGKPDLIMVGEWMKISVLINLNGTFVNKTREYGLDETDGWWNSINGGDFDNDGDIDYLAGNYGLNSFNKVSAEFPLEIYAKDFDHNGIFDPVITNYISGIRYISHPKNTIVQMIPSFGNRFDTYESYGNVSFENSFTQKELEGALHLECKMLQSIVIENIGGERFEIHELPLEAQFSPVFGSMLEDFNNDNKLDILLIGNSLADEDLAGHYDASYGNILINEGDFNWKALAPARTNFVADGDKKALVKLMTGENPVYLLSENNGYLKAYSHKTRSGKMMKFKSTDWYYQINLDNLQRKVELYYGSGFLSSSSRWASLPADIETITITDFSENTRKINLSH